jgi:hypothetical protein
MIAHRGLAHRPFTNDGNCAMIVVSDDRQPAAVLAAVKDASRRHRRSPAAILDRRCARLRRSSFTATDLPPERPPFLPNPREQTENERTTDVLHKTGQDN